MITKGELARATMTWKEEQFAVQLCLDHSSCLAEVHQGETGILWNRLPSSTIPDPYCTKGILSGWYPGACLYHTGQSPFPPLGPSTYTTTQTSKGIACRSTCLPSQHGAPSCLLSWLWLLQMGNYTQGSFLDANLLKEPECPPRHNPHQSQLLDKVAPANWVPPVALLNESLRRAHPWSLWKTGSWRNWTSRA